MITFKKIRWKNLLSTGNVFTEVDLSSAGTTLLVGENGAGKSTILDALTFSLFGKPFRNINKPQLINSINRKDMVVEVDFHSMSNEYTVSRGMKPNLFEVYCNGKLMNQSADNRDYQDILEKQILKINYKSFCQVVVLGSASFVPFMQLPAAQRRAIIEDLLDLEVFTTMNVLLKEKINTNQQEAIDNDKDMNLIEEKIEMVKTHMNDIRKLNDEFIEQKNDAIASCKSSIDRLIEENVVLDKDLSSLEASAIDSKQLQVKLDKLKNLRAQLEVKNKQIYSEISFFDKHDSCPTCQQKIDDKFKCDAIVQKKDQLNELEDGLVKLQEKYMEASENLESSLKTQEDIAALRMKIHMNNVNINHLKKQISDYKKEIEDTNKKIKESGEDRLVDLDKEYLKCIAKYNELQEDRQVLAAAATLLKDGGIKTKIINQYIPVINKLINKYLSEFDLFVEFHLDDQFNETIKSRYRDDFSYASFSEGEKQRIDLAILFTWRAVAKLRNSLSTNILLLDEVFDSSLDGNSADDLLKILNDISKDTNVFIISHRENLFEKFSKMIKFTKNKNFSSIEGSA